MPTPSITLPSGWGYIDGDDFSGSSLNSAKWGSLPATYGQPTRHQTYQPQNIIVSSGTVKMRATRKTPVPTDNYKYWSGGFESKRASTPKRYPCFGYFEAKMKLPHGQGAWPAFWLTHPSGGGICEVDIMEYFHAEEPGKVRVTIWNCGDYNHGNAGDSSAVFEDLTVNTSTWHPGAEITMGVLIQLTGGTLTAPTQVTFKFYLNGSLIWTYVNTATATPAGSASPNRLTWLTSYLGQLSNFWNVIFNLQIDGQYIGDPDGTLGYSTQVSKCLKRPGSSPPGGDPTACTLATGIRRLGYNNVGAGTTPSLRTGQTANFGNSGYAAGVVPSVGVDFEVSEFAFYGPNGASPTAPTASGSYVSIPASYAAGPNSGSWPVTGYLDGHNSVSTPASNGLTYKWECITYPSAVQTGAGREDLPVITNDTSAVATVAWTDADDIRQVGLLSSFNFQFRLTVTDKVSGLTATTTVTRNRSYISRNAFSASPAGERAQEVIQPTPTRTTDMLTVGDMTAALSDLLFTASEIEFDPTGLGLSGSPTDVQLAIAALVTLINTKENSGTAATLIAALVNTAPSTLDTLNELATALGNDPNFATTIATALGNKLDTSVFDARTVAGVALSANITAAALRAGLGSGTPSSTTFLRGDGQWVTRPLRWFPVATNDYILLSRDVGTGSTNVTISSSATNSNNTAIYTPFYVGSRIGISALSVYCNTGNGGASAVVRMGIHADNAGRPGDVELDAGTAALGSIALKTVTFTEFFLDPGWHWLVVATQSLDTAGTNPSFIGVALATACVGDTSPVASNNMLPYLSATVSGALAANPTVTINRTTIPKALNVWAKVTTP